MKKQVIAYLHTHWDREWYREYEVFRLRLLRVFDNILGMLENNLIPSFYFDGQIAALEDYLEMRPEKLPLIKSLIASKKLFVGPFYCLVDEFLTDKLSFSKNLEIGMTKAIELGCSDFIGYLADTFGHSQNIVEILRDFGIDKCIVWRGCGDFPAEFKWCGMDTVRLVRGYFNNIFTIKTSMEEKAKLLEKELDLISEKSGYYILLPIGADHLGVDNNISQQIQAMNELLGEKYQIKLGSPFEYFRRVGENFSKFEHNDELRNNSNTFTLQGCYSSRLDLKRFNIECSYKLDLATRFVKYAESEALYSNILEYAYKMLLKNQAHDSICGCSTDDVHRENVIRYKKILQIANAIIEELKFKLGFEEKMVLNLSETHYSGILEFESSQNFSGYEKLSVRKGFESKLLIDTMQIPVTEDYKNIYKYLVEVEDLKNDELEFILPESSATDLKINDNLIENDNIKLEISDNKIFINNIQLNLVDYVDLGDSYNFAPKSDDYGSEFKILRSRVDFNGNNRAILRIDFEGIWDVVTLRVSLDKHSPYLKFEFDWVNSQKNHRLDIEFSLLAPITEVYSEDLNSMIKRTFNPEYDIRKNLPTSKGLEAFNNTAPMQRGLLIDKGKNNLGIVTKGLTQYEVFKNKLSIPILRATGIISNPKNPARTTPAGPPLDVNDLQMLGRNKAEFYVFFGNENAFNDVLNKVYNYIVV